MNRESTSGTLKLLVDYDVLANTITRLARCGVLLTQIVNCARAEGIPKSHISSLIGVSGLLETITDDFFEAIKACVDAEEAERKRRRQQT